MSCKYVIALAIMFMAVPMWIGYIWVEVLRIRGRLSRLLHAWVLGFATMLAVGQLVLVPLVALQQALTTAIFVWKLVLTALAVVGFYLWLVRWAPRIWEMELREVFRLPEPGGHVWSVVLGALALMLVALQAYIPARYEHSDDDDARFIAEEVSAYQFDMMLVDSPITAELMFWDVGEVRKDLTSPWPMFVAMVAKDVRIHPAILSHAYLPLYLIPLCYAVYVLIGRKLFRGDWEKTFMFLILLSVIHLAGYTSTHSMASMLLLRIWQGKAVCAAFMMPLMFFLSYQLLHRDYHRGWVALCYVASTGMCLLSGIGIVTAPVLLCISGFMDFCYYRNWRKTLAIWLAAVPCGVFLVYYLM